MFVNKLFHKSTKNPKGNISILVIFILVASSVIGMLTMHFVQQLLHYNSTISNYYKSYYMTRAGLELSLSQISNRGVGFEYSVRTGDLIIQNNFKCYPNCNFQTTIRWRSTFLNQSPRVASGCDWKVAYVLSTGQSMIVPFFQDNMFQEDNTNVYTPINYKNILDFNTKLNIQFLTHKDWESFSDQKGAISLSLVSDGLNPTTNKPFFPVSKQYTGTNISKETINKFLWAFDDEVNARAKIIPNIKTYLVIANTAIGDYKLEFCLYPKQSSVPANFPLESAYIKSIWRFGTRTMWLEAIYNHSILPSFLSHTSLGH